MVFFQIQLIKYQLLESYSNIFAKILFEYYELNKNNIMKEYIELESQSTKLLNEMKKKIVYHLSME